MDGHRTVFHILAIVNKATMSIKACITLSVLCFLQINAQKWNSLGHIVVLSFNFLGISTLASFQFIFLTWFCTSILLSLHPQPHFVICCLFDISHSDRCEVISHWFSMHSLIIPWCWASTLYLLAVCMSSQGNVYFRSLTILSFWCCFLGFLMLSCESSLSIWDIDPLSDNIVCQDLFYKYMGFLPRAHQSGDFPGGGVVTTDSCFNSGEPQRGFLWKQVKKNPSAVADQTQVWSAGAGRSGEKGRKAPSWKGRAQSHYSCLENSDCVVPWSQRSRIQARWLFHFH